MDGLVRTDARSEMCMRLLVLVMSVLVCCRAATIAAQNQTATVRVQVRAAEQTCRRRGSRRGRHDAPDGFDRNDDHRHAPRFDRNHGAEAGFRADDGIGAGGGWSDTRRRGGTAATTVLEETVTVVASTRTDKRLEDQPMRVEVLAREEIEEKMLMTPGDIVMMLNEMGGMRVQTTSPSLGAASVRIQGMRGRYTRVLSDGLPFFGEVGGLGLLQIPPMDLGQVEVIKGVASALYGAGAMGGVVNLLSRRPGSEHEEEFLFNRSTRGATDAVTFLSGPLSRGWSASLLGGRTLAGHQRRQW